MREMVFENRSSAGRELAIALGKYRQDKPVVLAIPRGGVIVGVEVARALNCQIDLVIPRKIGAPDNPELAIGAVVGPGQVLLNQELIDRFDFPDRFIDQQVEKETAEIDRRRWLYLGEKAPIPLGGRVVLIVDDGLATGYTALAATQAVKSQGPAFLVLAVPVAPAETLARFEGEVDAVVCLSVPDSFLAVGQYYQEFTQTTDAEVIEALQELPAT